MTDSVQLSIHQFTSAWRLMCGASARRASASFDGLELVFSGLPVAFFNVGLTTGRGLSSGALAASARRAGDWAAAHGVPWLFVTTKEMIADGVDAAAALDAEGFAPLMPLTGMLATSLAPATRAAEALRLTVPADDAACAAMIAINAKAYGMDLDGAIQIVGNPAFWRPHFPVVALTGSGPAACAAVMMVDGHRYVALVATDPAHQRRGYADASMRQALGAAAGIHGDRPTVLHATEAGRPMYERMGYQVIANHTVFMEKRFLAEH